MSYQYPNQPQSYYTLPPYGSAPSQIRLAGIFNAIAGSLSAVYTLGCVCGMGLMIADPYFDLGIMGPSDPPAWLMAILLGLVAVVSGAIAVIQIISSAKLLRRRRNCLTWAMVAGIAGCATICAVGMLGVPTLGAGIFSIVVAASGDAKRFIADNPGPDAGGSFPVNRAK